MNVSQSRSRVLKIVPVLRNSSIYAHKMRGKEDRATWSCGRGGWVTSMINDQGTCWYDISLMIRLPKTRRGQVNRIATRIAGTRIIGFVCALYFNTTLWQSRHPLICGFPRAFTNDTVGSSEVVPGDQDQSCAVIASMECGRIMIYAGGQAPTCGLLKFHALHTVSNRFYERHQPCSRSQNDALSKRVSVRLAMLCSTGTDIGQTGRDTPTAYLQERANVLRYFRSPKVYLGSSHTRPTGWLGRLGSKRVSF
jgi:hypothetical protein